MLQILLVTYEAITRRCLSYAFTAVVRVFMFRVVIGLMRFLMRMGMFVNGVPMPVAVRVNDNLAATTAGNAVLDVDLSGTSTYSAFL
jgi:hypothetical protein